MTQMRYHQHIDGEGEWVQLKTLRGFRIRCCDCRLVHVLDFRIVKHGRGHKLLFRAARDNAATAKSRKRKGVTAPARRQPEGG